MLEDILNKHIPSFISKTNFVISFGDREVSPSLKYNLEGSDRWYSIIKQSNYSSFSELRKTFPKADQVGNFTVFNIGGNKYRLIAYIVYSAKRDYIRNILTHHEYDTGKWKE